MLEVRELSVWYGQAQALFEVSLDVAPGEMVLLQGLNGAGKSTLLKAIMGLGPRQTGVICYKNRSIWDWPVHQRAQAGLGYVPEDRRLFPGLSVRDNLLLPLRRPDMVLLDRVLTLFPMLSDLLDRPAAQLSGGQQQMLALGRALMTSPGLLLLDEPCEGIAPVLVEAITQALCQLRDDGLTLLVAEHHETLWRQADRVLTLTAGQISCLAVPQVLPTPGAS